MDVGVGSSDHWMTRSSYLPQRPMPQDRDEVEGERQWRPRAHGCRGLGCEATAETLSYGTAAAVGQQQRFHSRIGSDRSLGRGWAMRERGKVRDGGEEKLVRFQRGSAHLLDRRWPPRGSPSPSGGLRPQSRLGRKVSRCLGGPGGERRREKSRDVERRWWSRGGLCAVRCAPCERGYKIDFGS